MVLSRRASELPVWRDGPDPSLARTLSTTVARVSDSAAKANLLDTRLPEVARRLGLRSLAALVHRLRRGDVRAEAEVIDASTTNETSFYRDHRAFEELTHHLLPPIVERLGPKGVLHVWSAACSSGQEAYTVGVEVLESFPDLAYHGRGADLRQRLIAHDGRACPRGGVLRA